MVNRFLNHKSKTVFSAAMVLAITGLISRILGLFRDRLLAGKFGAGDELDIYFAAFRLPDLIYNILIIGAISSAFIPVFAQYFRKDEKEAWRLTSGLFNLILIGLVVISLVLIFFAPWIVSIIAPGFSGEKKEMTVILTRIMFLSPLLLGMSSILSGVLQYFHRFFVYSLAPIMYNLGIIFGILFFVPKMGLVGLAWGVALGAFLHFLMQLPSVIYSGFKLRLNFRLHEGIKKIIKLTIPRTIGLVGSQINYVVITALASSLAIGSVAIFNLANNLQYVPIGIIGISFALAVFPSLASSHAEENKKKFSDNFTSIFNQILYLVLPISVIFFVLRAQIVRLILGTGQFGWVDTRLTAAALGIFAISVFAQSLIPLISRAFYSVNNTKTPVSISLISIGLNVGLSFGLVWILNNHNFISQLFSETYRVQGIKNFAVLGLPLAFSLANIFNFSVLLKYFDKKIGQWNGKMILDSAYKMIISCVVMAIVIYGSLQVFDFFFDTHRFTGLLMQSGIAMLIGVAIYFLISFVLKMPEPRILINKIIHPKNIQPLPQENEPE